MALLHIPLDQIDKSRLQALITARTAESHTIEYKRTIYGTAHVDYSEFLADTSSASLLPPPKISHSCRSANSFTDDACS